MPQRIKNSRVQVAETRIETFRQNHRGRPGPNTRYIKQVKLRYDLKYEIEHEQLGAAECVDGVFPLVSNDQKLSELELLHAYKRQPLIEKRFEQLKTDFAIAPMWLKDVARIDALLGVYYLAWRDPDHPAHHRLIVTPHAAFYSEEGLLDIRLKTAEACRRALSGQPLRNVVN